MLSQPSSTSTSLHPHRSSSFFFSSTKIPGCLCFRINAFEGDYALVYFENEEVRRSTGTRWGGARVASLLEHLIKAILHFPSRSRCRRRFSFPVCVQRSFVFPLSVFGNRSSSLFHPLFPVFSFFFIYERIPTASTWVFPCSPKHRANYFLSGFSDSLLHSSASILLPPPLSALPLPSNQPMSPVNFLRRSRYISTIINPDDPRRNLLKFSSSSY